VIGQHGEISTKNALNHLRKHEQAEKADDGPPAKRKRSVYERLQIKLLPTSYQFKMMSIQGVSD
jgi:hypothetical protein